MNIFDVNEDIRKAETLDSRFYTDSRFLTETKEKIFARTWQYVGERDEFSSNDLLPKILLEGCLNEPLLLSKTGDVIRCLSNVCTHRAKVLVGEKCNANNIRCSYHGRRFSLDGKFLSMPEFESAENFPSEKDNLPNVSFREFGKLFFASLAPAAAFDEFFGEIKSRLNWLNFDDLRFDPSRSQDYFVKAHWALYCENYLEGLHIPFVHQKLNSALDFGSYTTELYCYSNLQLAIAREGECSFDLPETSLDFGRKIFAYYYWVFPNMMFNFYPWGLSMNIVQPLGIESTKVSFLTFLLDEKLFDQGAAENLDTVEMEDEAVVESVQIGVKSRLYSRGRYSPTQETGTHHFHRLIGEFMT